MADALVPYGDTRIVLHHNYSVVLYDPASKRVIARNRDPDERGLDTGNCPTCGRPYAYAQHHQDDAPPLGDGGARGDASPEYFNVIAGSLTDVPASPVKQLGQPMRSSSDLTDELPPGGVPVSSDRQAAGYFAQTQPATDATQIDPNAFSKGYFNNFFQSATELGRGGKGVVLKAKHAIDGVDLGWYAIKRIPVGNDHRWLMKILTEVQLLSKLKHENLVQYKHAWLEEVTITKFGPSVPCAFILQEFCNAGDLQHWICGTSQRGAGSAESLKEQHRRRNSKRPDDLAQSGSIVRFLSLDDIYSFFKQITAGVNYLHEHDYVHRDLKPSNCLLHDTGSELMVLVSDFGEVQAGDEVREGTGATGTISYCAPEVLKIDIQTGSLGAFTRRSDVFSLGMVLHFLCFGQLPYQSTDGIDEEDEDVEQLKDEISKWSGFVEERSLRSDLPDALYQHLSRLLSTNPGHRPSASEILAGLESLGVSGRISGGRRGSTSRPGTSSKPWTKEGFFEHRRGSRAGGTSTERNRSRGSTSGMSSSALTHSTTSLRRHISPPTLSHEATSASGETAVDTEPDSTEDEPAPESFRKDSIVIRSRPVSRASSPLKDAPYAQPPLPPLSPPLPSSERKLITAAGEDNGLFRRIRRRTGLSPRTAQLVKLAVFVGKMLSLYLPCLPAAANPRIALPLLGLALSDFAGPPFDGLLLSTVLLLTHALLILNGRILGADACMQPTQHYNW